MRFHGLVGDLAAWANSFCSPGRAGCVMIPSCKNSRAVAMRLTAFSRYKETVGLGSVRDKKTARGEANSATVHWGHLGASQSEGTLIQPGESQSFVNEV